jgi:hypothetical protein
VLLKSWQPFTRKLSLLLKQPRLPSDHNICTINFHHRLQNIKEPKAFAIENSKITCLSSISRMSHHANLWPELLGLIFSVINMEKRRKKKKKKKKSRIINWSTFVHLHVCFCVAVMVARLSARASTSRVDLADYTSIAVAVGTWIDCTYNLITAFQILFTFSKCLFLENTDPLWLKDEKVIRGHYKI